MTPFQAQKTTTNGGHEFGFTPDHPALCVARREVGYGQDTSVRPDNEACPAMVLNGHGLIARCLTAPQT